MGQEPLLLAGLSKSEQEELLAEAHPRLLKPRDALGVQGQPVELLALVQIGIDLSADGIE